VITGVQMEETLFMLFLLKTISILTLGVHPAPSATRRPIKSVLLSAGDRWPKREALSSAKIKNACSFTYMFTVHFHSMTFRI
jgi:hypothetical protein